MRMANARRREFLAPEERSNEREQMSETRDFQWRPAERRRQCLRHQGSQGQGSSTVLKRGTVIRGIHLTDDPEEIEGRTDKVKGLVLKTCS